LILLIDNYDSFTYNLVDYFEQLNTRCDVVKNDVPPGTYLSNKYEAMVISPGPGLPEQAGYLFEAIKSLHNKIPVLGICLGHQAICEYFGARLTRAIKPMHGKLSKIQCQKNILFANLPEYINVVRYHSLICQNLPETLENIAFTEDFEIMAIQHRFLPIWGIQFHPEAALTEYGLRILKNWINAVQRTN